MSYDIFLHIKLLQKANKTPQITHTYMQLLRMNFLSQASFWCAPTVSSKEAHSNIHEFILFIPPL